MFRKLKKIFKKEEKIEKIQEIIPVDVKDTIEKFKCPEEVKSEIYKIINNLDETNKSVLFETIRNTKLDRSRFNNYLKRKILPKYLEGSIESETIKTMLKIQRSLSKCKIVSDGIIDSEFRKYTTKISPKSARKLAKKMGVNI